MDVLFLSVSTGEGHTKAAQAIEECIREKHPQYGTLIVDTLKFISPALDKLILGSYFHAIKNSPSIYKKLYKLSDSDKSLLSFSNKLSHLLSGKLENLISEFNPSIIVCTHVFPLKMMSWLKQKKSLNVPLVAVVTDFTNHSLWKENNVDAYVVAHKCIKDEMMSCGITPNKVYTYGIPVSGSFMNNSSREQILHRLGLDNKLTFLLMDGSMGIGNMKNIFSSLLECKSDIQIIAVAGKNQKLKEDLDACAANSKKNVKILSYTDRVAELMEASDFIITKPGGMTISEALVKELPILINSPIPGQEEKNAYFLINSGAAARISADDNIDSLICQIVENPHRIKHMKESARYLAKPSSAKDITSLLESLMQSEAALSH